MKGRTGFVLGVAVGYVLGARAGRSRYEQIMAATAKITEQEQVQAALEATAEPRSKAQRLVGNGLRGASRLLRDSA